MLTEIPKSMREKYPEMVQVAAALAAYKAGKDVTTRCLVCNDVLIVEVFLEVGVLVVACPHGCTRYRTRWTPQAGAPHESL